MSEELSPDVTLKILIIGDSGVGKSSLLLRFVDNIFSDTYSATIGMDFKEKIIPLENKQVNLQIWDTAGQERFRTITSAYYRGAHVIVVVYDVSDQASFTNLKHWLNEITNYGPPNVEKLIVGNKIDLQKKRVVSEEVAKSWAEGEGVELMECSAKENFKVEEMFIESAKKAFFKMDSKGNIKNIHANNNNNNNNGGNVKLFADPRQKKSRCLLL